MNIPFFNIGKTPEKRRNKIIVFANQKGGCGKTTNCVLSAGQFVLKHHCRLVVLDGDPQRSIVKKHEQDRERWPQLPPLYQVVPCTQLSSEKETLNLIRAMRNEDFDFFIDTPGSLTQEGYLPLLFEADAIVTTIQLEKTCINGTTSFVDMVAMVARENGLDKLPPFYFLPNQFNKNWGRKDELVEQQEFLDYFAKLGTVLPKIPNSAEVQRYSTLYLTDKQHEIVDKCYDTLYDCIYNEKSKSA
ncbi:ParA family protein [uncultured Prevotella sp.]|uniref:ParA family protein n=1 Tax=uncultured Prevotella sp. TaxID=159272 RepID=UPI002595CE9B|nr:ParA family protein [uncultured Prevotella sp.]